jgi:hypothetical protein
VTLFFTYPGLDIAEDYWRIISLEFDQFSREFNVCAVAMLAVNAPVYSYLIIKYMTNDLMRTSNV